MNLWPVIFVVFSAFALYQLDALFPDALRQDGANERLVYFGFFLLIALVYGFRFRRVRMIPLVKIGLAWAAIFSGIIIAYGNRDVLQSAWATLRGEIAPTIAVARVEGEVELRKAFDGHFRAVAKINGANVGMLIDTGASIVLLSYEDAVNAGLSPQTLDFSMPVTTANGRSFVAPVTIDTLTIGSVGLDNVRAAVAQPGKIHSSLLGMSFIGRLQETSFRQDRLILRN